MRIFDARTSAPSEVDPLLCDYHEDPVLSVSASVSSPPSLSFAPEDDTDHFGDDRTSTGALHQNLDKLYFSKRVRKIWKTISSWLRGSHFLLEVSGLIREVGSVSPVQPSEFTSCGKGLELGLIEFCFSQRRYCQDCECRRYEQGSNLGGTQTTSQRSIMVSRWEPPRE